MKVLKGVVAMQPVKFQRSLTTLPGSNGRRSLLTVAGLTFAACISCTTIASAQGPVTAVPPPEKVQQHSTELPPGEGRDTVMKVCSKCHSPNILVANPRGRQGWEDTITKMSGLGAMATDDEFTTILEYLAKNVTPTSTASPAASATASPTAAGKVNINKATSAEIVTGLALTSKDADAVVAYRTKNGDFKTLDDVKKVPALDAKKLDDNKDKVAF
jgi:competence protein ComEA